MRPRRPPEDPEISLSRVLSYSLRHRPDEFGLTTDQYGNVPLNELLVALRERPKWADLTEELVTAVVEKSGKQRFEIHDGLIRARYGHSFDVTPGTEPEEPPEALYHGTPREAIAEVMEDGLKSTHRQYLHLSVMLEDARQVGERRDPQSVVLEIQAKKAHGEGVKFHRATDEIWLCESVPPAHLKEV